MMIIDFFVDDIIIGTINIRKRKSNGRVEFGYDCF